MADAPQTPITTARPALSLFERRLLGVLVEKAKTTPDVYPMSINSLMTGANQKSNRDPVLTLTEDDVQETLLALRQKNLVTQVTGGRVERWRHNLYEQWTSSKVGMAIVTELLLRGPQTEGELRGRASRMEPIEDLEVLRGLLHPLIEQGLVVMLGPEGRRGTLITHGFHDPAELEGLRSRSVAQEAEAAVPRQVTAPASPAVDSTLAELRGEIADLRAQLQSLRNAHHELAEELRAFKSSVGG